MPTRCRKPCDSDFDQAIAFSSELRLFDRVIDALGNLRPRDTAQARREGQVLADAHLRVDRGGVRQVAHPRLDSIGRLDHVHPVDAHRAARRQQVAGQDAQRRGFARPVETQEAHDLPLLDANRQRAYCPPVVVVLIKLGYLDHDSPAN